jgi:hypothetical protein
MSLSKGVENREITNEILQNENRQSIQCKKIGNYVLGRYFNRK